MTRRPSFGIAQSFAQNWSQCSVNEQHAPAPAWPTKQEGSRYQHSLLSQYQTASLSDDSDQSSQTSYQDSASEGSEDTYSSPPSSTGSDEDNICESQVEEGRRTLTQRQTEPAAFSAQCNAPSIANVTFRPKHGIPSLEQQVIDQDRIPNTSTVAGLLNDLEQNPPPQGLPTRCSSSRRRGCLTFDVLPKLRRDTDNTDAIVKMIVVFCTNLINSIWCPRAMNEGNVTSSPTGGVLPLQIFITETLRRSKTSYSTLQVALYYLILLKQCLPALSANGQSGQSGQSGCRAMQCGRRMFLTALILASKYLQDRNYSARAWSKISGLPLKEINDNERRYLSIICWDLHVPKDTFENWSKIVLAVCRLSNERDSSGSNFERRPPSSSGGLGSIKQVNMVDPCNEGFAAKSWWLHHLGLLRTDIVRCSRKTDAYLHSVSPFKPVTPMKAPVLFDTISRSYSPESMHSGEKETTPRSVARLPSIEQLTQTHASLERSASPMTTYTLPPPPMLRNLPTPQTTPRSEMTNLWTGSVFKPSLRCQASASALRNIEKTCLPFANLETCPPPPPRTSTTPISTGCPLKETFQAWRSKTSTPSITSSPESVISDFSYVASRSRSSSVSSAGSLLSSGASTPVQKNDSKLQRDMVSLQQKLAAQRMPTMTRRQQLEDLRACYSRPQTAFKVQQNEDDGYETSSDTLSQSSHESRGSDEGYTSDDLFSRSTEKQREAEAAEALLAFHHPQSSRTPTPRSCSVQRRSDVPTPSSMLRHSSSQLLKRTRSESLDAKQFDTHISLLQRSMTPSADQDAALSQYAEQADALSDKQIHPSESCWATPRKPIQCRAQNKRLAMQLPCQLPDLSTKYINTNLVMS